MPVFVIASFSFKNYASGEHYGILSMVTSKFDFLGDDRNVKVIHYSCLLALLKSLKCIISEEF